MNDKSKNSQKVSEGKSGSASRGGRSRNRNRGRNNKEMEVNIKDAKINTEDLPHIVSSAKGNNDPSWYTHIYPLVGDVASVPFNIPVGNFFNPIISGDINETATIIPGILTLRLAPTCGTSTSPTSAVNIAAQQIYTLDRAKNSGATNYDKTDLMMTILAMDSAYMLFEDAVRAYKLLGSYNYMNRYLPNGLLQALGWDPKDLNGKMADFRAAINLFAYELASINVPDQFDFIHRHSWLFTNVYKDSNSSRAQMYAFVPDGFYKWTEGQDNEATHLEYVTRNAGQTLESFIELKNSLMQPLLGSQDVGTISGDLAKAFGEGGMIKIQPIEEHAFLEPVYNQEVLLQIANAVVYDNIQYQNMNIEVMLTDLTSGPYIYAQPSVVGSGNNQPKYRAAVKPFLNFPDGAAITPENVLVATRLASACDASGSIISSGTEIAVGMTVWSYANTSTGLQLIANVVGSNFKLWATPGLSQLTQELELSKFDWCPARYYWAMLSNVETYMGTMIDINDYRLLESETIDNLNEVAVMSEFAVKDYGTALT